MPGSMSTYPWTLSTVTLRWAASSVTTGPGWLAALATDTGGPTRSALEDAFLRFLERFGLPRPLTNVTVAGYLVDAFYPQQRLIVELDGWAFHGDRQSFEVDRERDAVTGAAGHRTLRLTHARLSRRPHTEAARLRAMLGL